MHKIDISIRPTIEDTLYLEVLVEDETKQNSKGSDTVILDCYDESELLNKIRDGKFRLFLLVFVDEVGKSHRGSIVTRYGRSITSIAVERDADVSSSTVGGYINYKNGNIGDFDENRLQTRYNQQTCKRSFPRHRLDER